MLEQETPERPNPAVFLERLDFCRITSFWGRNKYAKQAGMEIMGGAENTISFWPVSSKGPSNSAMLTIQREDIPKLIKILQEAV